MSTSGGIFWIPPVPALPDVGAYSNGPPRAGRFLCCKDKGRQHPVMLPALSFPRLRRSRPLFHIRLRT